MKPVIFFTFCLTFITSCFGQVSIKSAIERQFNKIESDILAAAQAMPDDKFDFSPADLQIQGAEFKGVRTFAGQIMHLATDNILIWSAITGEAVRPDIQDVNGPGNIKTKKDVIEYLKTSFAIGRKSISTLTTQNFLDVVEFRGRKLAKLDLAFYGLTHSNEHYGQMVVYLRMCGLIPPATMNQK
jgi:hypothetical protein